MTVPGSSREILALAIPALGALLVEPVLLLVDSAVVGHWSTDALAGLGLAQTVLTTVVGLCVFLAYSTTASTARAVGAGNLFRAIRSGISAIWLAVFIGVVVTVIMLVGAQWIVVCFGTSPQVVNEAVAYLQVSSVGLPAMLVVQAATGIIRGLQDTRMPLFVSSGAAVVNIPLSVWLTLGLRWGVVGAATGTVICQYAMAVLLVGVVVGHACRLGVGIGPDRSGVGGAWRDGLPLLVRTVMLRIALILLVVAVTRLGTVVLAANQIIMSIWGFFASGLDALAIAAQALTGKYLGGSQAHLARATTARMTRWAVTGGIVMAVVVGAVAVACPAVFTPDIEVQHAIRIALVVVLVGQPLAGYVYILDGVLMGAGDTHYLAKAGVINLVGFLPVILLVIARGPTGVVGLVSVWICWVFWYMAWRGVTLRHRITGEQWMRLGQ